MNTKFTTLLKNQRSHITSIKQGVVGEYCSVYNINCGAEY